MFSPMFVCLFINRISQKLMDKFGWNFQGWLVMGQGPSDYNLGKICAFWISLVSWPLIKAAIFNTWGPIFVPAQVQRWCRSRYIGNFVGRKVNYSRLRLFANFVTRHGPACTRDGWSGAAGSVSVKIHWRNAILVSICSKIRRAPSACSDPVSQDTVPRRSLREQS